MICAKKHFYQSPIVYYEYEIPLTGSKQELKSLNAIMMQKDYLDEIS